MAYENTVLVTGANGFVGGNVVDVLLQEGKQVVATDLQDAFRFEREYAAAMESEQLAYQRADITQKGTLEALFTGRYVSEAIHVAALFNHDASYDDLLRVNDGGTLNLFTKLKKHDVERVIHIGSSSVYGHEQQEDESGYALHEGKRPNPMDNYARSKQASRERAASFNGDNGMKVAIVDPTGIFGPRNAYGNVMVIEGATNGAFFLPDGGVHKSSNIHGRDVAGFSAHLLNNMPFVNSENPQNISYLAATPDAKTGAELMEIVWKYIPEEKKGIFKKSLRAVSKKIPVKKWMARPLGPVALYGFAEHSANPSKMLSTGYRLQFPTIDAVLEDTMRWHVEEGLLRDKRKRK